MTSPTVRNKSTVTGGNGTTFAPTIPTGTQAGDVLLAAFLVGGAAAVTAASSFTDTIVQAATGGTASIQLVMGWKIAVGSDPTPSWSWTGSLWRVGGLLAIQGAQSTGTPVELSHSTNGGSTAQPPNDALTGNASVDDLVFMACIQWNGGTWAAPAGGWALEWNSGDDIGMASIAQAAGGAPATTHLTITPSPQADSSATGIIAIKAAAAPTILPGKALRILQAVKRAAYY